MSTNSTTIATSQVDNHFYLIVNKIKKFKDFVARRGAHLAAKRSPSDSEGGWSEAQPNGEVVASGSATFFILFVL